MHALPIRVLPPATIRPIARSLSTEAAKTEAAKILVHAAIAAIAAAADDDDDTIGPIEVLLAVILRCKHLQ